NRLQRGAKVSFRSEAKIKRQAELMETAARRGGMRLPDLAEELRGLVIGYKDFPELTAALEYLIYLETHHPQWVQKYFREHYEPREVEALTNAFKAEVWRNAAVYVKSSNVASSLEN